MTKQQNALHKKSTDDGPAIQPPDGLDHLLWWNRMYFDHEVTTAANSQKAQKKDIIKFLNFMYKETGSHSRIIWTPRLSRDFIDHLRGLIDDATGRRVYADGTINRNIASMKTFSKWVHKKRPFPNSDPMKKISTIKTGTGLDIEKALTAPQRRRMLEAADRLLITGGISRDRARYRRTDERPRRKGYRPYRNRAIIYLLIETGMRRAGACNLLLADIDFKRQTVTVTEKGGNRHTYNISRAGLDAIQDYIKNERPPDAEKWQVPNLFMTSGSQHKGGKLSLPVINNVWAEVCKAAGVEEKTPHSARHGMGAHIVKETGNIAAVQQQLGHRNGTYSMIYAGMTGAELREVLEKRR